ncbi:hydrogenase nickel incorporation protein [Novipirellula aureliae]|uniref:Hydrogenase maturation factor HypA n=1 Tax=Novipirellula aureliae TaxID=2527966 RepID=A0A5C6EA91_9BACT|nr:hydrogenase maturation nickel metallochaperone HypA [Novipirellula aureliae]TWU44887.1 hydrogenase nickel incorporation protein [Novipirellula aureliae]
MHELSIALNVLDIAEQTMNEHPESELVAIHIRLGPMSGVVCEALESAFTIARQQTLYPEVELVIEETQLLIDCPQCRKHQMAISINDLRCRTCGTISGKIVGGRELEIAALEVRDEQLDDTLSRSTDADSKTE